MRYILEKLASNQILALLSYPPYLSFSLSVFFSQIGFNMLNIVLIFLVFYLTSSNFAVAVLLFTILVPQVLLSFIGGIVADIANKKKILVIGNLLRAAILIILFFNFNSLLLVYFITLIVSVITQFYVPAESPLIPVLVKRKNLIAANSIFGIGLFGSILIGYVIAGPAVAILGRSGIFLFLSLIFFFAAIFAFLIPSATIKRFEIQTNRPTTRKSIWEAFKESFLILKKTKSVGDAFFLLIFSQIIIFVLAALIPGYATNILQIPTEDMSLILFAPAAVGMIMSAFLIGSVFNNVKKEKLMNLGILLSGIVLMLLPFTSRILAQEAIATINLLTPAYIKLNVFNFVLLLALIAGFANALIFVPSQAVIQEIIPQDFRSKIYGLLFAMIGIFSIIPIMAAGGVADLFGVGAVFFSIGLGILLVGLIRVKFLISFFWILIRKK